MSWQGSLESWIDDAIDKAAMHSSCPSREEAEDYVIDYLMASRCGTVDTVVNEANSLIGEWAAFSIGCHRVAVNLKRRPGSCREESACHWAAARWLERKK